MNEIYNKNELEEEVYKCSKCALCKQICPPFQRTKNETLLAKGRCIVLNEIFKGNIKLSNHFLKSFRECIGCNKCMPYCPSSINMEKIAKSIFVYYYETHKFKRYILRVIYKITKGKFGLEL